MQRDGNLVVYAGSTPKWATGTMVGGTYLAVQEDGNVVTYSGSWANWATSWHSVKGQTRTNNAGASGNCTWYAYERFKAATGSYPSLSGDAGNWDNSARATGWLVRTEPSTQSIVVFERGVQGAGPVGHVGWVDAIQKRADGIYIHVVEMNARGLGVVSDRWVKHVTGMSYILANQK